MRTQGSGPRNPGRRTRDPGTQDTEPQDPGSKIRDLSVYKTFKIFMLKKISSDVAYSMYSVFLVIYEKRTFIERQNKTLKSKKSLTRKRDNAKYHFTYFPLIFSS